MNKTTAAVGRRPGPQARLLHSGHFAFMRGVVQGLDVSATWERYVATEGEATDLRRVKSTIAWIRDAFAAAAKRHAKPGTARLVAIDARSIADDPGPNLEEFATAAGLEGFSEAEQLEAYLGAYPYAASGKASRRARFISRQLEALRWLESLVAQEPGPQDGVGAWFTPTIAAHLERRVLRTLDDLITCINGTGMRWWTGVGGIGEVKAGRIVSWLRQHERSLGRAIGSHALSRRSALTPADLSAVTAPATDVVPFEKFVLPDQLDGSRGTYRAPQAQCLLGATNDYKAIETWLNGKHDPNKTGKTATHRAYRKEAERLLLWAILERHKPLSSLNVEDVKAFTEFLRAPPARWCGPKQQQRWSPHWRPMEGPLSPVALRQTIVVLRSLFAYLVANNYLIGNAFASESVPTETGRLLGSKRTLTFAQWDAVEARLRTYSRGDSVERRGARSIRWLYATGLRLSEMANAECGDLRTLHYRRLGGEWTIGWLLSVKGKGDKLREVPVPAALVQELEDELAEQGLEPNAQAPGNKHVAVLHRSAKTGVQGLSTSGLARALKKMLSEIAEELEPTNAERLRKSSAHWLRHTHGSHALNGRPGKAGVAIQIVQNNLGHASIGTTSGYLTTELGARLEAMMDFGTPGEEGATVD